MSDRILKGVAAAICAVMIGVSALGLRFFEGKPPAAEPFSSENTKISLPAANAAEEEGVSEQKGEENSDTGTEADGGDSAVTQAVTEQSASEPSQLPESPDGGESYSENTQSVQEHTSENPTEESSDSLLKDDGEPGGTAGNETTDGGETEEVYFVTDIPDGETVSEAVLEFTVTHLKKELTVRRTQMSVNGRVQPYENRAVLSQENGGKNVIKVSVTYVDKEGRVTAAYKSYTVYLKAADPEDSGEEIPQQPSLVTDLYNHTRSDSELTFFAYISGDVNDVSMKVYCKNQRLKESAGEYRCTLDMGVNKIRITAEFTANGEQMSIHAEYEINLIAATTPETAPYLAYCNVPESVRGSLYTLDLAPRDYSGGRLYADSLTVRLGGSLLTCRWEGEYSSYLLELADGENTLDIRVTDKEGRYSDYSYIINSIAAADGEVIGYAVMSVDANVLGLGDIGGEITVEIRQGESAARSIVRALEQAGFEVSGSGDLDRGYYLQRLHKEGIAAAAAIDDTLGGFLDADGDVFRNDSFDADSLGDRDFTSASGWMISVNDHFTSYGTSDLHLKDGDRLRLRFTLAMGKDIGGYMGGENYAVCY